MKQRNHTKFSIVPIEIAEDYDNSFLYNRMDLLYSEDNYVVVRDDTLNRYRVYVHVDREHECAYAGVWLLNIEENELKAAFEEIIKKLKVNKVYYKQCLHKLGRAMATNHWMIELPNTSELLWGRISPKGRNTICRKQKKLLEVVGKYTFEEYAATEVPREIVNKYFEQKYTTMGTDYGMTEEEYLSTFHVTNVYSLKCDIAVLAIVFSCEQTDIVYLENLSYDVDYSRYSCGLILYTHFLERLIEKGKRYIYLGDGNQQYKSRFGSVEQKTYNGEYEKKSILYFFRKIMGRIKRKVIAWKKRESL